MFLRKSHSDPRSVTTSGNIPYFLKITVIRRDHRKKYKRTPIMTGNHFLTGVSSRNRQSNTSTPNITAVHTILLPVIEISPNLRIFVRGVWLWVPGNFQMFCKIRGPLVNRGTYRIIAQNSHLAQNVRMSPDRENIKKRAMQTSITDSNKLLLLFIEHNI